MVGIGTLTTKFGFLILTRAYNHRSACIPLFKLVSSGYIRLVSFDFDHKISCTYTYKLKRVVVLKDQKNKKAHVESAQLACEGFTVIWRTKT